jgi:hypothetical protein
LGFIPVRLLQRRMFDHGSLHPGEVMSHYACGRIRTLDGGCGRPTSARSAPRICELAYPRITPQEWNEIISRANLFAAMPEIC